MLSDLSSLYIIVGKVIVWGGLGIVGALLLGFVVMITVAAVVQISSVRKAKRYIRHWELIRSYVGWEKGALVNNDDLHQSLVDCLNDGVRAYESTPGEGAVKLHAAMHAWCSSMGSLKNNPKLDNIFHPLPPEKIDSAPTSTPQAASDKNLTIVGTLPEDT